MQNKGYILSLKENIDRVKEELNSEEKFFEKAVMTERFVKKYKNALIGSFVVIVVAVGANIAYDANSAQNKTAANEARATLQKEGANEQALAELKAKSKTLYDVWQFAEAIKAKDAAALEALRSSNAPMIADLAAYESAKTSADFDKYASKQGALYKDLALVQSAVLLMGENKTDKAHQKLLMISPDSPMAQVASALLHYGVK